jgi:hypothetical protein
LVPLSSRVSSALLGRVHTAIKKGGIVIPPQTFDKCIIKSELIFLFFIVGAYRNTPLQYIKMIGFSVGCGDPTARGVYLHLRKELRIFIIVSIGTTMPKWYVVQGLRTLHLKLSDQTPIAVGYGDPTARDILINARWYPFAQSEFLPCGCCRLLRIVY